MKSSAAISVCAGLAVATTLASAQSVRGIDANASANAIPTTRMAPLEHPSTKVRRDLAEQQGIQHSVARMWSEALLDSIRHDLARPTVHARNLYHSSAAMWDAWAAFEEHADQVL